MYKSWRKNKPVPSGQSPQSDAVFQLSDSLESNEALFRRLFKNDDTVIYRRFSNPADADLEYCAVFVDGMVNPEIINEHIIGPILHDVQPKKAGRRPVDILQTQVIQADEVQKTADVKRLTEALHNGDTVLLCAGETEALIISSKGWPTRAISEPESEKTLRGPKEGFTESLMMNLSMVRRRLHTDRLKFSMKVLGARSRTKACICYIEGLASPAILAELEKRLDQIKLDGILGTGYLVEFIKDAPLSPFKTIGNTERPDVVAAKLLEGRVALILDGSPVAITLPHVFVEYFQSNDDYYINFYFSSINRMIRIASFLFAISVPAIYLALTTFHEEILPTPLLLSISAARQGVAFPTAIELLILGLAFEILREAGMRMPSTIGEALSIVGALILGQAAVQARLVSAPMVIIIGLTAVTGLMIPGLSGAIIILRFVFVIFVTFIGFYGYLFGMIGLLVHLFQIRSFGVPYMTPLNAMNLQDLKDTVLRAPWWYMINRPRFIGALNRIRQGRADPGSKP
ncbi:spore germination protein KA [Hydrogenispora ethanolica]|uniref:Spore germination protein KA n=1 Tax=Hydrogenispora ethanolica TaxID=1082276 RepID=A0A4R1SAB1_HYDET|nr:spore germination protein [Hydrogenispora ethanolica]TCL76378.1 spore germination protein KA [Hydrogenispora ethanolica]